MVVVDAIDDRAISFSEAHGFGRLGQSLRLTIAMRSLANLGCPLQAHHLPDEHQRNAAPFDVAFWLARTAELIAAGFDAPQAARLVEEVRARVDPASAAAARTLEETA